MRKEFFTAALILPLLAHADDPARAPSKADVDAVMLDSHKYFDAKDSGDYMVSYAMFESIMKQNMSFKQWMQVSYQARQHAGASIDHRLVRIDWSREPANFPPGDYAEVYYLNHYENLEVECGRLTWHRQVDGSFLLMGDEQGMIPKEQAQKMTPEQLAKAEADIGCVTG